MKFSERLYQFLPGIVSLITACGCYAMFSTVEHAMNRTTDLKILPMQIAMSGALLGLSTCTAIFGAAWVVLTAVIMACAKMASNHRSRG